MGFLEGKVAVITAAGSGMGKASAKIFAREGAKVVISDISGKQDETAAEIGDAAIAMHCDASKEEQVAAMIDTALSKFGRLDAMLNVAGLPAGGFIETIEEGDFDAMFNVSLKSTFWGAKHAIRAMKDTGGGAIINWSSLAGIIPAYGSAPYSAAKAGVAMLTKSIAIEAGKYNIRSNALCPGLILTQMGAAAQSHMPTLGERNPLGRAGEAEDAGELAAFLASDRAKYINGVLIPLDGGWSAVLGG
jgi:NAD(P)-dependent dehydrogenase (short-subunit alcohol dehydrogenase family)